MPHFNTSTWISGVRLALDLSQQEFASKVGVSQGIVSRWESGGALPAPEKLETINKLAPDALKVEVGEVILANAGIQPRPEAGKNPLAPPAFDEDLMTWVLDQEVRRVIDYSIDLAKKDKSGDNARKFVAKVIEEYKRLARK